MTVSFARGNIVSNTQVSDLYAILKPLLIAQGYVELAETATTPIQSNSLDWHVWKNPAANSGLAKDYHFVLYFATSGTGGMFFRMFEDWVGAGGAGDLNWDGQKRYEFGCKRPAPQFGLDTVVNGQSDAFGLDLFGRANTGGYTEGFAVPQTDGNFQGTVVSPTQGSIEIVPADGVTPDYSLGVYALQDDLRNEQVYTGNVVVINKAAPHIIDFRSHYVGSWTVECDDETAIEYVLAVDNKHVFVSVFRVFNNAQDQQLIAQYSDFAPNSPGIPIVNTDLLHTASSGPAFTRNHRWAGTHHTDQIKFSDQSPLIWSIERTQPLLEPDGRPGTTGSQSFSDGWKGAMASRIQLHGYGDDYRGLLSEFVLYTEEVRTDETPVAGFGDELTINGTLYVNAGRIYDRNSGATQFFFTLWVKAE